MDKMSSLELQLKIKRLKNGIKRYSRVNELKKL